MKKAFTRASFLACLVLAGIALSNPALTEKAPSEGASDRRVCGAVQNAAYASIGALAQAADSAAIGRSVGALQVALESQGSSCLPAAALRELRREIAALEPAIADFGQAAKARTRALDASRQIPSQTKPLEMLIDDLARDAVEANLDGKQLYIITRLLVWAERLGAAAAMLPHAGLETYTLLDRSARDIAVLSRSLAALRDGNAELGIVRLGTPRSAEILEQALPLVERLETDLKQLAELAPSFEVAEEARYSLIQGSERLARALGRID